MPVSYGHAPPIYRTTCVAFKCDRAPHALSLCKTHYNRWRTTGSIDHHRISATFYRR